MLRRGLFLLRLRARLFLWWTWRCCWGLILGAVAAMARATRALRGGGIRSTLSRAVEGVAAGASEDVRELIRTQTCERGHGCRCRFDGPLQMSARCCVHGEAECGPEASDVGGVRLADGHHQDPPIGHAACLSPDTPTPTEKGPGPVGPTCGG